jgi:hypothetical protein
MLGRTLKPPALIRLTYCGSRLTPCPSEPLQVGGRHEGCDGCGVGVRQADRGERVLNEGLQPVKSN